MKKIFFAAVAVMALSSCTMTSYTASTERSSSSLLSATIADLEVSDARVSAELIPSKAIQRGGEENVKHAVERKALGDKYDVLVDPEYTIERKGFGKKIKRITVTGRPAKYKGFRSLNDSVWCNPTFRIAYKNAKSQGTGSFMRKFFK